ncbi:energy-coupling factor ABC transporter permease [Brevibacillus ginsengisoli]|uniref:energy-coupling factor ABC transporter permease n=1 Tax=Brevibacillus ginsengisoli TaxID=363854 RepID=UPI003CEC0FEB
MKRKWQESLTALTVFALTGYFWINSYETAYAMHISEGFLPLKWVIVWWAVYIPFLILGVRAVRKRVEEAPETKMLLGLSAAFTFVLSALKLPSVTGSSSHATGTGLGTALFGPLTMSLVGFIVLLFQALLLAHGGLTTLGANAFSMAVAGPMIAYAILCLAKKLGISYRVSIFLAAFLGNITTYLVTSFQLALAFPAETGGVLASFAKFAGIFMITQVPLAASEGLLTVVVINLLLKYNLQELSLLKLPIGVKTKHE